MKALTKFAIALTVFGSAQAFAAPPVTAIVGNWHFDEGKGQKTLDVSGNNKVAQLGASASTVAELTDPLWIARRFDNPALRFDGNNSFVRVPFTTTYQPAKITVEAWVKGTAAAGADLIQYMVSKSGYSCSTAAYALYSRGGDVAFYISPAKGEYVESPVASNVWDGNWHHLVGTYDAKSVRLYVDGVQAGTGTAETRAIAYNDYSRKDLYIGSYDDGSICYADDPAIVGTYSNSHFQGDIDEVRIWSRALTATEVGNLD
jgi:Concanavalin A-like lectin/glucanases superfamily